LFPKIFFPNFSRLNSIFFHAFILFSMNLSLFLAKENFFLISFPLHPSFLPFPSLPGPSAALCSAGPFPLSPFLVFFRPKPQPALPLHFFPSLPLTDGRASPSSPSSNRVQLGPELPLHLGAQARTPRPARSQASAIFLHGIMALCSLTPLSPRHVP
jgi:hypothetical protein